MLRPSSACWKTRGSYSAMRLDPKVFLRYRPVVLLELLRLWFILLYIDTRLKLYPPSWNRFWLSAAREETGTMPGPRTLRKLYGIAVLLRTASRFRIRTATPCLCLSLALRARLAPLGLHPTLVYGVRKSSAASGGIDAHAWLKFGISVFDPLGSSESFNEFSKPAGKVVNNKYLQSGKRSVVLNPSSLSR
jgi:hypothetical protein